MPHFVGFYASHLCCCSGVRASLCGVLCQSFALLLWCACLTLWGFMPVLCVAALACVPRAFYRGFTPAALACIRISVLHGVFARAVGCGVHNPSSDGFWSSEPAYGVPSLGLGWGSGFALLARSPLLRQVTCLATIGFVLVRGHCSMLPSSVSWGI